ncbi:vacuolar protein sorting-associated protein 8 [Mytilus galloprovincialis]|uniref:Vacuolar protein sorting-associated protein 8 n=1 Tax=Mytilus galloprovincialis TaxID=29158 RepID=A0A8B6H4K4_MYTGA|nr:vacuolar protein sorting-associated protein 8 [Mytilus galloprovincialis]
MAVADDEKRSDVLEDANKIEVSFEPSEFGSSSPLTKVADPGSPGKNLNTCTVSLTTLEPGFPRRPVQSTSAGITHSCVGTQEYEHVVSKSRRSSVVAEHEHYRSAVKSLHSTFSITSDKNYLKSSPDDRCSDENVFNAAELPEDTLNETEILNDMSDIGQDEEMRTEDDIKELEKDRIENAPQEMGTLTSTGEDETEILNDMADIGQDEEMKTEDDINGLEKYGTKNAPQEKGTSTRTGGDETEILNDMADIGQDEEEKTVGDIKDLEKDRTENIPQEKGTSTGEKGSSSDPVNKFASVEKVALESLKMMMKMPMKMLIFFLMIKNLIPSISKKIISQCKYHSISMIREDKFLDGLDTVLNKLSNVICQNAAEIKCTGLQKIQLQYNLLNITWMNPRTLVAMDTKEKIHVIDVRSEEELEVIDVSEVMLVYNTSHFKSLATGGNVSQALAFAGEKACYQTIVSHNGQLFILGTKTVHLYTLRSWRERIDVLAKQNKYQDALALALSFYEGNAKAVVGLTGSSAKRKQIVADLMLDMLFDYVDLSMTTLCPEKGKMEELEEYYMTIVPVCVDHCLYLNRTDILFGRIYERFSEDMIAMGTFLECLEPYILGDKLMSIPPSVMKDFVDHYQSREMLESVEACIVHLEVTSLDIHQVW